MKHFWQAVSILIGTTVGAGILGVPYVVAKSGFLAGIIEITTIGLMMLILNLYIGELALRTHGKHQLTGYAEKYLGRYGKTLMMAASIFGIYGALLAYIIGEGSALSAIFGGSPGTYGLVFFVIVAALVLIGLKAIERTELMIVFANVVILLFASLISLGKINITYLTEFHPTNLLIPYGVILFSFLGTSAVAEMRQALEHNLKSFRKAIILGTVIPIIIYILFTTVVVGTVGLSNFETLSPNERIATVALGHYLSKPIAILANLFAVFSMTTAFLVLALALKDMFNLDYKIGKGSAWALSVLVPFGIYLYNAYISEVTTFIDVLGIIGAVTGGIVGIILVLATWVARKRSERAPEFVIDKTKFLGWLLIVIFLLGIIHELLVTFGILNI